MGNNQTSEKKPSLIEKNRPRLQLFIGLNIAVFLSVIVGGQLTVTGIDGFWQRVSAKDGVLALCLPLVTIVLNGVLSDSAKARLVFWRWRNPLPGCRAFSVIMVTDLRIDAARLRAKLGSVPSDAKEQNVIWYRLYKAHAEKQRVLEAHGPYLLTRDMTALAALFAVGFSLGALLSGVGWQLVGVYSGLLLAQFVVVATSARNYGRSFVVSVLVAELHG